MLLNIGGREIDTSNLPTLEGLGATSEMVEAVVTLLVSCEDHLIASQSAELVVRTLLFVYLSDNECGAQKV